MFIGWYSQSCQPTAKKAELSAFSLDCPLFIQGYLVNFILCVPKKSFYSLKFKSHFICCATTLIHGINTLYSWIFYYIGSLFLWYFLNLPLFRWIFLFWAINLPLSVMRGWQLWVSKERQGMGQLYRMEWRVVGWEHHPWIIYLCSHGYTVR